MLQQFTWQDFLIAALVFTLVWYGGVILVFYRKELKAFLNRKPGKAPQEPLPHRWENEVEEVRDEGPEDLMGRSKMPEGMESVSMGGFGFVSNEEAREQQVGLVPDVLEEIKGIFKRIAEKDGNKQDFFKLMEAVRDDYPQISSNPNIGSINGFVSENAPFHLSKEELENLWD
jgi:hypothetical protein